VTALVSFAEMFSPDMMKAAQSMMANMKPEDMQRMTQMASNMDPKVMENMMKGMGGGNNANIDTKAALDQMKNMTPEQMKASMAQAQSQMGAQKQYMYNAAEMLKNEGNVEVKKEAYPAALAKYGKALENLRDHVGGDVDTLKVNLLNNVALCHLKTENFDKAVEACEDALKIDSRSFKAYFRRGQAREAKGGLSEAFADVRQAQSLSPSDKAIGREFTRLQGELKSRGIDEASIPEPNGAASSAKAHVVSDAWKAAGGGSSGSTTGPGSDQWAKAAEQIAGNPDMLKQATEAMSKMSPEDLQRMMGSTPLPPGMDAETMKSQMEHLQKNPELLKTAMQSLQSQGGGTAGANPNPAALFENPDMIRQAAAMTKNLSPEDLKRMNINSPEEADMMRNAAEQMAANPELMSQMSDMMKNMPPDQLQKMMEMSSKMRGGASGSGDGSMPDMDPSAILNNPEMMKATEEMMKSMSPETLSAMARASGVELSEDKAKLVTRFLPYLLKLMVVAGRAKKLWSAMWTKKGRMVLAVLVVLIAVYQHYRS